MAEGVLQGTFRDSGAGSLEQAFHKCLDSERSEGAAQAGLPSRVPCRFGEQVFAGDLPEQREALSAELGRQCPAAFDLDEPGSVAASVGEVMIVVQTHGVGLRWYCSNCDVGHNGYVSTVTWTNSPPPEFCGRCEKNLRQYRVESWARRVVRSLRSEYRDRFVLPGSVAMIADLIDREGLSGGYNPHRLAAMINQMS